MPTGRKKSPRTRAEQERQCVLCGLVFLGIAQSNFCSTRCFDRYAKEGRFSAALSQWERECLRNLARRDTLGRMRAARYKKVRAAKAVSLATEPVGPPVSEHESRAMLLARLSALLARRRSGDRDGALEEQIGIVSARLRAIAQSTEEESGATRSA